MSGPAIRSASPADAAAIAAVYNWYVRNTTVTFEVEPVPADEMARRMADVLGAHEWLVLAEGGDVLGYAYAGRFHARPAYRPTTESTIYLRHGCTGRGLGTRLYGELVRRIFGRGYRHLIGAIALPNDASVRLHEKLGFVKAGHLLRVGCKFERWIDVGYWQLENPAAAGLRSGSSEGLP
jgi:phosphinothricin acetyltransferase